jgi:hypothetical protein
VEEDIRQDLKNIFISLIGPCDANLDKAIDHAFKDVQSSFSYRNGIYNHDDIVMAVLRTIAYALENI